MCPIPTDRAPPGGISGFEPAPTASMDLWTKLGVPEGRSASKMCPLSTSAATSVDPVRPPAAPDLADAAAAGLARAPGRRLFALGGSPIAALKLVAARRQSGHRQVRSLGGREAARSDATGADRVLAPCRPGS